MWIWVWNFWNVLKPMAPTHEQVVFKNTCVNLLVALGASHWCMRPKRWGKHLGFLWCHGRDERDGNEILSSKPPWELIPHRSCHRLRMLNHIADLPLFRQKSPFKKTDTLYIYFLLDTYKRHRKIPKTESNPHFGIFRPSKRWMHFLGIHQESTNRSVAEDETQASWRESTADSTSTEMQLLFRKKNNSSH